MHSYITASAYRRGKEILDDRMLNE
jgi:hypothetical protein